MIIAQDNADDTAADNRLGQNGYGAGYLGKYSV